jgi:drug/metabolite transporter (DMT)-like permease
MSEAPKKIFICLIIIQILFGINFAASKLIVEKLSPIVWANLRFLTAGLLLLAFNLIARRNHPRVDKNFLMGIIPLSLLGMGLGQSLFLFGISKTSSTNTAIITSAIPILTTLAVILKGDEKFSFMKVLGILITLFGVFLIRGIDVTQFKFDSVLGDFLVFMGALAFALFLAFGKAFVSRYDNLWITTWFFMISGIFMLPLSWNYWGEIQSFKFDLNFILLALYSIIGATIITYFLNNWVLKRIESSKVALFIYLQPVVAAVIGVFYLGEKITTMMVASILLIISGMIVNLKDQNN